MLEETIGSIKRYNIIISLVYVGLSVLLWSFSKTMGVAFGAILMIANFYVLAYLVNSTFKDGKIKPLPFVLYIAKFLVLVALAAVILQFEWVNKIFFILGTTVILASFLTVAVRHKVGRKA